MTASRDDFPAGAWVPVDACTLPTREQPLRLAEFDELFASTLRAVSAPTRTAARFLSPPSPSGLIPRPTPESATGAKQVSLPEIVRFGDLSSG